MGTKVSSADFEGIFKILDYRWLKDVHLKLRVALENGQVVDAIAFSAIDKYKFDPMKQHVRLVYELDKMSLMAMLACKCELLIWNNKLFK